MKSASAISLMHDHDVVGRRALARAAQQQPRDEHHDRERRQVDEDRNAGDVRRRVEQPVDLRIGAEQRRAIAGRQPDRQLDAEAAQQRVEVVAPRDRDGDVADGVFENQVPADDPRDQLAERRVRVGVGAAGLRNHRRQLRVAQPRERAGAAEQQEREDQRRSGAQANHLAVGTDLTGGGGADRAEDAGADHRADREHDQIAGAERSLQAVRRPRASSTSAAIGLRWKSCDMGRGLYVTVRAGGIRAECRDSSRCRRSAPCTGSRYAVSLDDDDERRRARSKATPTSPGPASTSSGRPVGGTR